MELSERDRYRRRKDEGKRQPGDVAAHRRRSIFNPLLVEIVANWRIRMIAHFTASMTFNFCRSRLGAASPRNSQANSPSADRRSRDPLQKQEV